MTGDGVHLRCFLSDAAYEKNKDSVTQRVKIYRQTSVNIFGQAYMEFFDGAAPSEADILYKGEVPKQGRKLEFRDNTVRIGEVYCYWIAGENIPPSGPVALKVRDRLVWWPKRTLLDRIGKLAGESPGLVDLFEAGKTIRQTGIPAIFLGNRDRCVALVGLIHPGEAGPEIIIPVLERLVREEPELLSRVGVLALPSVNIDEREREVEGYPAYLRRNSNGVDLNRNFPGAWEEASLMYDMDSRDPDSPTYRGPAPASEPETRAVMETLARFHPVAAFSFHCLASICSPVFLAAESAGENTKYLERCRAIAEPYWRGYYGPEKHRTEEIYPGCAGGSLARWLYEEYGMPAFDLEWDYEEKTRPCLPDRTTLEMLEGVTEQHYHGIRQLLLSLAES